jgi:predicted dehydrogenase
MLAAVRFDKPAGGACPSGRTREAIVAKKPVRWGILGPGKISRTFAAGLQAADGAQLAAVGSRSAPRAAAFAAEHGFNRSWGTYEDLAADPAVDAVYIGTPHVFHEEHTLLCLRAGKHVLVEKPFAINAEQAGRMIRAARENDRLLMEAMWTRFLPTVVAVRAMVAAGDIGEVRMLTADFGFRAPVDPHSRLFAPALGGGSLLDLGIYPLTLASMLFGEPVQVSSLANLGATRVDEEAAVIMQHRGGELAVIHSSLRFDTPRHAFLLGTGGWIEIMFPWWAGTRLRVKVGDRDAEILERPHRGGGYTHEAEAFMELIRSGARDSEIMPLDESLTIMKTMDLIRDQWGLTYPGE